MYINSTSKNKEVGARKYIPILASSQQSQMTSTVFSAKSWETTVCFLLFQEIKGEPRKMQKPVVHRRCVNTFCPIRISVRSKLERAITSGKNSLILCAFKIAQNSKNNGPMYRSRSGDKLTNHLDRKSKVSPSDSQVGKDS